jgi:hypothetical protein
MNARRYQLAGPVVLGFLAVICTLELSILTTYRAHPLVHVSFLLSAVPVLAVAGNTAAPAVVFTVYACLGALPHANLRWTYGRAGRVLISPAYHRIHHSATGRLDINLGTVFAVWDAMSRRAVFPARDPAARTVIETGLAGRPIPVEQAGRRRDPAAADRRPAPAPARPYSLNFELNRPSARAL